jgi:hypothetical protein
MKRILNFIYWFLIFTILNLMCAFLFAKAFQLEPSTCFIVLTVLEISLLFSTESKKEDNGK